MYEGDSKLSNDPMPVLELPGPVYDYQEDVATSAGTICVLTDPSEENDKILDNCQLTLD